MTDLLERRSISEVRHVLRPFARTHGATPDSMVLSPSQSGERDWRSAVDRLLHWKSEGESIFEDGDQPGAGVLETAIDFAVDLWETGQPAPTFIVPSGDGKMAFEWHAPTSSEIIEITGHGSVVQTRLVDGRVVSRQSFTRDPVSRRLERASRLA